MKNRSPVCSCCRYFGNRNRLGFFPGNRAQRFTRKYFLPLWSVRGPAPFLEKAERAHAEHKQRAKNECWHAASPKAVETAAVREIGSVFIFSALRTAQPQFPAVCMRMHPPPPYSAFLITKKRKIGICRAQIRQTKKPALNFLVSDFLLLKIYYPKIISASPLSFIITLSCSLEQTPKVWACSSVHPFLSMMDVTSRL